MMNLRLTTPVFCAFALVAALLATGCARRSDDSLSRSSAVPIKPHFIAPPESQGRILPDTVYPSARGIRFRVDIFDEEARRDTVVQPLDDLYRRVPGVFTFRCNAQRDGGIDGHITGRPTRFVKDWEVTTGRSRKWGGGTGWTGQPLYVCWPPEAMERLEADSLLLPGSSREEIIFGSLDGSVYFIDFATGRHSRRPVIPNGLGNPIKGTPSLDPTMNGNLYIGQGVPDFQPFGAMVYDLFENRITNFYPVDPDAWRRWQAYDSSPLRIGDYLFRPGENNTLYKLRITPDGLRLHSTLRYSVDGESPGIESSMSAFLNYGYVGDNNGNILCVNLSTMQPVWLYRLGDDVDASPMIAIEDGTPYIYVGCEVDKQVVGTANFVKLNALTGEEVWLAHIPAQQVELDGKHFDGGFYGSALPGSGNCRYMVFANCVLNTDDMNGVLVAFDRATGEIVYSAPLEDYSWSSPVGFRNSLGEMFVVTADSRGRIYLFDGLSGTLIYSEKAGKIFESSPVAIGNSFVIGSRGDKLYRFSLE